jgi:hypothetical protein
MEAILGVLKGNGESDDEDGGASTELGPTAG